MCVLSTSIKSEQWHMKEVKSNTSIWASCDIHVKSYLWSTAPCILYCKLALVRIADLAVGDESVRS